MSRDVKPNQREFTSTVLIISDTKPPKILLMHHKKYEKWMPPGGHIEFDENPLQTAIREVKEEVGLDINFLSEGVTRLSKTAIELPMPFKVLQVTVPPYQDSPEHFHIDFSYLVKIPKLSIKKNDESHSAQWFSLEELESIPMFESFYKIAKEVLMLG